MKHADVKQKIDDWLTITEDARYLSERDRDYKDNKQWTDEEITTLNARNQAPVTVNRIYPKVEGMKGLLVSRKTDPKAYGRTPKHEKAAEVVTDALKYVSDNVDLDQVKLDVADNIFTEGYGAAIVEIKETPQGPEIDVNRVPWDRYYFDYRSRRLDFADKMWDGIVIWMSVQDAMSVFRISRSKAESLLAENSSYDETFEDRPLDAVSWIDTKEERIRVCQHFELDKGEWKMGFLSSEDWLIKPIPSPYLDEFGRPTNPIESQAANIDRENARFGPVRYWIDMQKELNHRRSKFLHLLSTRQTAGRKGAIPDVSALKRELSRADGHVEYNGEKGDFEMLNTGDMAEAQFTLYQDGKQELDAVGFNAQLSGERQGDLSGRAIVSLQQAAVNELSSLYNGIAQWEKRIYRQIWCRIKQSWTEEKWIRVTDDKPKLRYVGLNQQITLQMQLEELIDDESIDLPFRQQYLQQFQMLQQQNPMALQQIVEVRNELGELDMDIILDVSIDSINAQMEQFDLMAKIAQTRPEIPFEEVIKLSTLRNKDEIIKSMEARAQANSQAQQQAQQLEQGKTMAETEEKTAKARKAHAEADRETIQTELLIENPPDDSAVVI